MGQTLVVRRFAASAGVVWNLISWRGMQDLAGESMFAAVEFESPDVVVGAVKRLRFATGLPIRERLEWLDEPGFGYGYRIIDYGDLPVADYVGSVRVAACGPQASVVVIRCSFVAVTIGEEEWAADWRTMESALLESVAIAVDGCGQQQRADSR